MILPSNSQRAPLRMIGFGLAFGFAFDDRFAAVFTGWHTAWHGFVWRAHYLLWFFGATYHDGRAGQRHTNHQLSFFGHPDWHIHTYITSSGTSDMEKIATEKEEEVRYLVLGMLPLWPDTRLSATRRGIRERWRADQREGGGVSFLAYMRHRQHRRAVSSFFVIWGL